MGKETKDDYDDMDAGAAHQEMTGEAKWLSTNEAKAANEAEHAVGFWKSIRQNRPAVLWSLLISTSVIMEGYDTSLMPNFPAYPSFRRHYGSFYPNLGDDGQGDYQLSSAWQAGLVNASNCGVIIGGFINGWASARFGYRRTMVVSMVFMAAFLFVVFFSPNNAVLCVGQILCGIPWGIFATTGPAYASEVLPLALRGYLTVYINLCWAAGQLLAAGILKGLVNNQTQWSYRIPWAIQWIWPPLLVVGCVFAPESPWWLVKNGRLAEAEKTLHRLAHRTDDEVRGTLSQMLHTIQVESELESGGSYLGCFKGTDLRRTEICCFTFMTQMLSGAQFAYGMAFTTCLILPSFSFLTLFHFIPFQKWPSSARYLSPPSLTQTESRLRLTFGHLLLCSFCRKNFAYAVENSCFRPGLLFRTSRHVHRRRVQGRLGRHRARIRRHHVLLAAAGVRRPSYNLPDGHRNADNDTNRHRHHRRHQQRRRRPLGPGQPVSGLAARLRAHCWPHLLRHHL